MKYNEQIITQSLVYKFQIPAVLISQTLLKAEQTYYKP